MPAAQKEAYSATAAPPDRAQQDVVVLHRYCSLLKSIQPARYGYEPVDPKPSLKSVAKTVKEMMKKKKDDVATMADTEKEKEKKTTLVGSKKTPVDTKPEVEYKN